MAVSTHRDACLTILSQIFGPVSGEMYAGPGLSQALQVECHRDGSSTVNRSKVYLLLGKAVFLDIFFAL